MITAFFIGGPHHGTKEFFPGDIPPETIKVAAPPHIRVCKCPDVVSLERSYEHVVYTLRVFHDGPNSRNIYCLADVPKFETLDLILELVFCTPQERVKG